MIKKSQTPSPRVAAGQLSSANPQAAKLRLKIELARKLRLGSGVRVRRYVIRRL
jgi:hypothetical protein